MSWLRLKTERRPNHTSTYLNLDNGTRLGVATYSRNAADRWEVWLKLANGPMETLADGYATVEEAEAALDDLMGQFDFIQLQPPVSVEEQVSEEPTEIEKVEEVK